jgi:hypothetical protein
MAKKVTINRHLRSNPLPAKQGRVLKDTLKALNELEKAGYPAEGYDLGPAYGGNKVPEQGSRRLIDKMKMTYIA